MLWDDLKDAIGLYVGESDKIKDFLLEEKKHRVGPHSVFTRPNVGKLESLGAKKLVDLTINDFRKREGPDGTSLEPTWTLEYIVSILSGFNTSDPRDTINCLRNISGEVQCNRTFPVPSLQDWIIPRIFFWSTLTISTGI